MMYLSNAAKQAIQMLETAGYEAYVVGGSTRDSLRGMKPHDFDITTSAEPNETKLVFQNYKVIETGISHGTVTVLLDGEPLEITTFRLDSSYQDHRHPDSVSYTKSLREDLARRDFTMNAIAYSPSKGYIDPFSGKRAISQGIIETVGEPVLRFEEDALRILRALRFASVLNYQIEEKTKDAIHKLYPSLSYVSFERIREELTKLLLGVNRLCVLVEFFDVFSYLIPELKALPECEQNTPYHTKNVWEHTLDVMANLPLTSTFQLAALFHDIGKPDSKTTDSNGVDHFKQHAEVSASIASKILTKYRFSNKDIQEVTSLIRFHDLRPTTTRSSALRFLYYVKEDYKKELTFIRADYQSHNLEYPSMKESYLHICNLETICDMLIQENAPYTIGQLDLKGSDLSIFQNLPQYEYKHVLEKLLFSVIDLQVENKKEKLLALVPKLF